MINLSGPRQIVIQLVILSALILFTELVVIRWLSANILSLSYFSNIILVASFFGLGLGALIGQRRYNLLLLFPFILGLIVALVATLKIDLLITDAGQLFFQGSPLRSELQLPFETIAVIVYILVATLFIPLGQRLGHLLNSLPPLKAYSWDIAGSLAGIALFTGLAWLQTSPLIWFGLIAVATIWLFPSGLPRRAATLVFIIIFLPLVSLTQNTLWSPYYKITLKPILYTDSEEVGWELLANSTGHQTLEQPERKEPIYQLPYDVTDAEALEKILIIGAGAGSDTATALINSSAEVTAVDIDPLIIELGTKLHPAQPYASPNVTTVTTDGRVYLEQSRKQYDLIIFALTDSLTLASTYSNTRLESYLFTLESFTAAKERLSDQGLLVLYNYYRQPWLIQKLGGMLSDVFGQTPYILADQEQLAALIVGPGLADIKLADTEPTPLTEVYRPATDDWPFLYLQRPHLPSLYIWPLALMLLVSLGAIIWVKRSLITSLFRWHFFWLGAGFLLLETKNVVNFAQLFGATWLVNSLVFFAILVAVLAANLIIQRYTPRSTRWLYLGLGLVLLINLIIPLKSLLVFGWVGRYILATLLTFSPIVLANLIFARSFLKTKQANLAFGANLLGAVFGGFLEYTSLIIGYHYLLLLIIVLYFFSWLATIHWPRWALGLKNTGTLLNPDK